MALEGFDLKYDYGDAPAEARMCRTDCALFDFSFLECARLEGRDARGVVETMTGRSMVPLGEKEIFYALRVNADGDLTADWTVWRTGEQSFEVMSGRREDTTDLLAIAGSMAEAEQANRSVFAVQGPRALDALRKLGDVSRIESLRYFTFEQAQLAGISCTIGRLGYTGEAGFEIIAEQHYGPDLWRALSAHVQPAGFTAADVLRIEAGFVLFANEFRLPVTAQEVGLSKFGKTFDTHRPEITLVSFRADADGLSWPWQPPRDLKRPVTPGTIAVTSACESVVDDGILGLGYVVAGTTPGAALHDPMGTFRNIRLVPRPFYDPEKQRPRVPWRAQSRS